MMGRYTGAVLGELERLFNRGSVAGLSEEQLLGRFVEGRDDAAFSALVARHGPMVLGLCRRLLRDEHDVEDAFQATFLVFVRRAGAIRDGELVGRWIHGVAYKVAVRARALAARRNVRERSDSELEPAASPYGDERHEIRAILDEELSRLPDTLRSPLILCYLEGLTHDEAAERLRWPVGTVRSRMSRARELLRRRLSRRGLVANGAILTATLVSEPVPAALLEATVRSALMFSARNTSSAALASASAAVLAKGVLHAMTVSKLTAFGAATLACALALGGVRTFAQLGGSGGALDAPEAKPAASDRKDALIRSVDRIQSELVDSAKRNAALQKEIRSLRSEIEALRKNTKAEKGAEAKPAQKTAGRAGAAAGPGRGRGMMGGMGAGMGAMGMGMGGGVGGMGGSMGGMMNSRMGAMGMMAGGMGGMMGGGDDKDRIHYIQSNQIIVVTSPEGDRVTAYSTETGKAKSLRLSESKEQGRSAVPIVSQGVATLQIQGSNIEKLAAFSVVDGNWYEQRLREPVEEATPIVSQQMAAYPLGRYVYAFSATAKRWDVLALPEGATGTPAVGPDTIIVENEGHLYVFGVKTGKWEDINTRESGDTAEAKPTAEEKPAAVEKPAPEKE